MARYFVGQEFEVWLGGDENAYLRAVQVDTIPYSSGSTLNFGPLGPEEEFSGPASEVLGLQAHELVLLRILLGDDLQVTLDEPTRGASTKRPGIHRMVDVFKQLQDPKAESTLFWLYGSNHDLLLRVKNPRSQDLPLARVTFYGWRIATERIDRAEGQVTKAITRGWS